ncbi:SdiA-regulated domain-containing protein [Pseudomonas sp.]|uniref:SdiA-regulated domain-containing protein n=1 Tax=Pseudomonas sp. TaxID=306 RepID=UPI0028AEA7D5|nr:SdiA-regulated domain-containing protein [Pseudomonas sp.]
MRFALTPKILLAALLVVLLVLLSLGGQHFRLFERGWFALQEWRNAADWETRSVWLPDYRVTVEGRKIEGLDEDLSALTYDPDRKTLFSVTNKHQRLVELSLDGRLLRSVELVGFRDPEAVEYVEPNVYVIADERRQQLVRVQLDENTRSFDASTAQQLSLGLGTNGNKGFEGLGYDIEGKRLFVAKERDPVRIYEVRGFPYDAAPESIAVHVLEDRKRDAGLFVRDLSSLEYDRKTGHLLVLSDESRMILELDVEGRPISSLSLRAGQNGLVDSIPQPEGLAMDEKGALYIVSEPNLFYRFEKPAK